MNELVSIIVPVFNVQDYVERCLNSIINQSYKSIEIIVVDDGSTDGSKDICDKYLNIDKRIIVVHKENGGLSDARNFGLEIAKGEYVCFVDADDWCHKKMVENLHTDITKYGADISICNFVQLTNYICDCEYDSEECLCLSQEDALLHMLKQEWFTCSACGKMFNRTLFSDVKFPVGMIFEDQGTIYKLFLKADKVIYDERGMYYYFQRENSIQHSSFNLAKMDELQFAVEQKNAIDSKYPELHAATTGRLVSSCFHILFGIDDERKYKNESVLLKRIIRNNRNRILFNSQVGKKVRLGCFVSYFGFGFTRAIYKLTGVRGMAVKSILGRKR